MVEIEATGLHRYFSGVSPQVAFICVLPFILLLLSIAILPLALPHFWEKNRNKAILASLFGLPVAGVFLYYDCNLLIRTMLEYGAFIGLLGSLFIISGGIYIRGSFKGTPLINTVFFAVGAVLANFIGTTGASMLLIRPLIRANQHRHYKVHTIIFFIFIVSNCSGILTPLGDPPLFLGFLKGVSFGWTFRLMPQFLFVVGVLLLLYFIIDRYLCKQEPECRCDILAHEEPILSERFGVEGRRNFILLFMIVLVSLFSGYILYHRPGPEIFGESFGAVLSQSVQIIAFAVLAVISYRVTPGKVHEKNHFSFHPINEVAILFAGIFAAMIPALLILETQGNRFGIDQPWQFFWLTGGLSSFLDNAPTYLTFTSLSKGMLKLTGEGLYSLATHPVGQQYLAAISCGAVFMGANTYIGNGPNFMVKSIAEHHKIKMPSFFHYTVWSVCVLVPIFILLTMIFLWV